MYFRNLWGLSFEVPELPFVNKIFHSYTDHGWAHHLDSEHQLFADLRIENSVDYQFEPDLQVVQHSHIV